jgi:hypothetical protein
LKTFLELPVKGFFLQKVAKYWGAPVTNSNAVRHAKEMYGIEEKKKVKYMHCLGSHNAWTSWYTPQAQGNNSVILVADGFDS